MNILVHPTYFPSIAHWIVMVKADSLCFEIKDSYQKQTYRNRTLIYGANGKLSLSVPVIYSQNNRQLYKDIKISNDSNWQGLHWKSLLSAYRTSPFFEFYEDELAPLFQEKQEYLLDYNFKCIETIFDCLQINSEYNKTTSYKKDLVDIHDYRYLVNARKEKIYSFNEYTQVFSNKHGFLTNLSILDLLFNEGPNTLTYLESQTI